MAQDPYGYASDEIHESTDRVAPWLTLTWMVLSAGFAAICAGCSAWIGVEADEPTALDKFGVGLIASVCAWPALGVTAWSLVLHLVAKRWWAQAGPNLVLGLATGTIVWMIVLCSTAMVAGGSGR